eukprot:gene23133-biopygen14847
MEQLSSQRLVPMASNGGSGVGGRRHARRGGAPRCGARLRSGHRARGDPFGGRRRSVPQDGRCESVPTHPDSDLTVGLTPRSGKPELGLSLTVV